MNRDKTGEADEMNVEVDFKDEVMHELEEHSVERIIPPTKLFPRLAVNKTILKSRVAGATGARYLYVGFFRRNKIPRCSAYDVGESNPVPASGL